MRRNPSANCGRRLTRASILSICGPPPCATTGFAPRDLSSATSAAKDSKSASSRIAAPAQFRHDCRPAPSADLRGDRGGERIGGGRGFGGHRRDYSRRRGRGFIRLSRGGEIPPTALPAGFFAPFCVDFSFWIYAIIRAIARVSGVKLQIWRRKFRNCRSSRGLQGSPCATPFVALTAGLLVACGGGGGGVSPTPPPKQEPPFTAPFERPVVTANGQPVEGIHYIRFDDDSRMSRIRADRCRRED